MLELVGYLWNSSEFHMYHPVSSEHGVSECQSPAVSRCFKWNLTEPDGTWRNLSCPGRPPSRWGRRFAHDSWVQQDPTQCDAMRSESDSQSFCIHLKTTGSVILDHIFLHFVKFNEFRMPSECLQNAFAEFVVSRSELCTTRHPENRGARKPPGRCPDNQQQWGNLGCGWNMIKHDKIWFKHYGNWWNQIDM